MNSSELVNELPENYEELKKSANRASNCRGRLDAVEELGKWNHKRTIDILKRVMTEDAVYQVQVAAYHKLKQLGEDVQMPVKKPGDLVKDTMKTLVRIKKSLPRDHSFEAFKEKLQKMRIDLYDTYEGDKGADFDQWLEQTWSSLRLYNKK